MTSQIPPASACNFPIATRATCSTVTTVTTGTSSSTCRQIATAIIPCRSQHRPYIVYLVYSQSHYKASKYITSRAGQAGGGTFKRENNYTPKKKIAYRMCAGRPTSAMPKPRFLCAPAFGRSVWWWRFGGGWLCFRGVSVVVMECAACGICEYVMSCGWLRGEMK